MFERSDDTYAITPNTLKGVLTDNAGPLLSVVNYIPSGSRVLDVGAGNGLLAMLFAKVGNNVEIDGIEPNRAASKIARKHYKNFYIGYVQDYLTKKNKQKYDYIVLADVIEHVINPEALIKDIIAATDRQTKIIVSTPNIAFGALRLSLLNGNFKYVDSGVLERTHLRFFTKQTLEDMISRLEIGVEYILYLQRRMDQTEVPINSKFNKLLSLKLLRDELSSTYQFFFVLSKDAKQNDFSNHETVGERLKWHNIFIRS